MTSSIASESAPLQADARFSMLPYFERRMTKTGRRLGFRAKSVGEFRRWQRQLRRELRRITGYDTMVRAPLRPRITETVEMDGYVRQRIEIQTEPGVIMPLYALVPSADGNGATRRPA